MKRRLSQLLLGILITAAGALLLFGPRPRGQAPNGRVRIQYWEKWAGHEAEQIRSVVDAFNDTVGKEKGIWVDLVSMSQIDRKTLIATAGGVPPDVAGLMDTQLCQFASKGALEPLDSYANAKGLTREYFKPVFYDGCTYKGHLYALPSTPWAPALLWNKQIFEDNAADLSAAGLDPSRPPRSIDELNRYAAALDTWEAGPRGSRRLKLTGYLPMEPGWWINQTTLWFGGRLVDETGEQLQLTSPQTMAAYNWIRGFSERLGKDAVNEFRGGFGTFDSPQNAFLTGQTAMVKQGPWMFSFIEKLNPAMNRWRVPAEELRREKVFGDVKAGMTLAQVSEILGAPAEVEGLKALSRYSGRGLGEGSVSSTQPADQHEPSPPPSPGVPGEGEATRPATGADKVARWAGGVKNLFVTFKDDRVSETHSEFLPARDRQKFCQWGVAPFPTAVQGLDNVTYAGMDILVIPSASEHKAEAFEFIAFVNRQDQSERFNAMHCSLSPLAQVNESFLRTHPNPYVEVFEALVSNPNARPAPRLATWPQLADELARAAQRIYLLEAPTAQILEQTQRRAQQQLDRARLE